MEDLGVSVPFLVGGVPMEEFSDVPETRDYAGQINRQLRAIAENTPGIYYVSSKGMKPNADFQHICAQSQRIFGARYYRVFAEKKHLFDEDILA